MSINSKNGGWQTIEDSFRIEFEPIKEYEGRIAEAYAFLIALAEAEPEDDESQD